MNNRFKNIKKLHSLSALLKSAACGVSAGLLATGIILLSLKLCAIQISFWYYILMGVGIAAIATAIIWLIIRPTDKKVAKRIDDEYAMHEKVQTALEFSGTSGAIVNIQRNDADEKLNALTLHKPDIKKLWQFPVILIVSLAIALTAILIPAKPANGDEDPYDRPPTRFEVLAMQELIENVEDSSMHEDIKEGVLVDLNQIVTELELYDTVSEVMPTITYSIADINVKISKAQTFTALSAAFERQRQISLSEAVATGDIYKDYALSSYELVNTFNDSLVGLLNNKIEPAVTNMREEYKDLEASAIGPLLGEFIASVLVSLESSKVAPTDGLYATIDGFLTDLSDFKSQIDAGTLDETHFQHNLDMCFADFTDNLIDAVKEQCYHLAMNKFIGKRIKTIFGLPIEDESAGDTAGDNGNKTPGSGDGDDKTHQGGFGSGDVEFGSDDMIFDPDTGAYVTYGDLLAKYYSMVLEYLEGDGLTDEQKNMARHYFEILFSGIKADD